jgi:hypothetical protein
MSPEGVCWTWVLRLPVSSRVQDVQYGAAPSRPAVVGWAAQSPEAAAGLKQHRLRCLRKCVMSGCSAYSGRDHRVSVAGWVTTCSASGVIKMLKSSGRGCCS